MACQSRIHQRDLPAHHLQALQAQKPDASFPIRPNDRLTPEFCEKFIEAIAIPLHSPGGRSIQDLIEEHGVSTLSLTPINGNKYHKYFSKPEKLSAAIARSEKQRKQLLLQDEQHPNHTNSNDDEPAALVQCNCGAVELRYSRSSRRRSLHSLHLQQSLHSLPLRILGQLRFRMECCCCDCNGIGYWAQARGGPTVGHHAVDLFIFNNAVEINRGHEHIAFYTFVAID